MDIIELVYALCFVLFVISFLFFLRGFALFGKVRNSILDDAPWWTYWVPLFVIRKEYFSNEGLKLRRRYYLSYLLALVPITISLLLGLAFFDR